MHFRTVIGAEHYEDLMPPDASAAGGGRCVANCLHPENRAEGRCDPSLCFWDADVSGRCDFLPTTAATFVRATACTDLQNLDFDRLPTAEASAAEAQA